ncbi:MAG: 6-phosphofructokinase [Chitinophagales bacterium]|nr:6-phosphofructokinase [Chitinophagales bacterium]
MKRIGILTSGGDAPGMNSCIRSIVITALQYQINCIGILNGYNGLIQRATIELSQKNVKHIMPLGGTILKTSRSKDFFSYEGRQKAFENYRALGLDGLIVIGGDGSFRGAKAFQDEFGVAVIGIPGTIDNDLLGTDYTIGYDTAINTAMHALDQLRDTAQSHNRVFFVELMGHDAGLIAIRSGLAAGAEDIHIPEIKTDIPALLEKIRQKPIDESMIIVVSEGDEYDTFELAKQAKDNFPELEIKTLILGHLQRGGSPTAFDRLLASRFGLAAVKTLVEGKSGLATGIINGQVQMIALQKVEKHLNYVKPHLLELMDALCSR